MYFDNPSEFATLIIEDILKAEHFTHSVVTVKFGNEEESKLQDGEEEADVLITKTDHGIIVKEHNN